MTTILIASAFQDKGTPKTGLSPAITIYDLADNSVVVNAATMSEVAHGIYKYSFTSYDATKNYAIYVDGGVTLGATDRYQYFGGGWDGNALQANTTLGAAGAGLTALPDVTLATIQGKITWDQQKIVADVAGEGALDIENTNATGYGQYNHAVNSGQRNEASFGAGQYNQGSASGQGNYGTGTGAEGQLNYASGAGSMGVRNLAETAISNEGQVRIVTDVASDGAIHIENQDAIGVGVKIIGTLPTDPAPALLGTDGAALISTDAQDLSATLKVGADVKAVNGTTVAGHGTIPDPWRPA